MYDEMIDRSFHIVAWESGVVVQVQGSYVRLKGVGGLDG